MSAKDAEAQSEAKPRRSARIRGKGESNQSNSDDNNHSKSARRGTRDAARRPRQAPSQQTDVAVAQDVESEDQQPIYASQNQQPRSPIATEFGALSLGPEHEVENLLREVDSAGDSSSSADSAILAGPSMPAIRGAPHALDLEASDDDDHEDDDDDDDAGDDGVEDEEGIVDAEEHRGTESRQGLRPRSQISSSISNSNAHRHRSTGLDDPGFKSPQPDAATLQPPASGKRKLRVRKTKPSIVENLSPRDEPTDEDDTVSDTVSDVQGAASRKWTPREDWVLFEMFSKVKSLEDRLQIWEDYCPNIERSFNAMCERWRAIDGKNKTSKEHLEEAVPEATVQQTSASGTPIGKDSRPRWRIEQEQYVATLDAEDIHDPSWIARAERYNKRFDDVTRSAQSLIRKARRLRRENEAGERFAEEAEALDSSVFLDENEHRPRRLEAWTAAEDRAIKQIWGDPTMENRTQRFEAFTALFSHHSRSPAGLENRYYRRVRPASSR